MADFSPVSFLLHSLLITSWLGVAFGSKIFVHHITSNQSNGIFENATFPVFSDVHLQKFEDQGFLKISHVNIGKVDQFTFDRFKHLNLLEISDSNIREKIHPQTFSRLPGLEILVLRNIGLTRLELNLTNVQELIVSHNKIAELQSEKLKGENINYLDVSNNELKALNGSLSSLIKLSMIDMSRNKIYHIGNHVFERNFNLVRILALENKITSTEGLKLPWLKTLDLFSNRLTVLKSDAFLGMISMEELVLAFNDIRTIEDPFTDLIELKFLDLAWNRLEEIKPEIFRNNLYLSRLSLQGNKLKSLNQFVSVHHHLSHLDLSHNALSLIDDNFFLSTPNLKVLDLSFNRLKAVAHSLEPLAQLKILDLAYNNIIMGGFEFSKNYQLTRVNLSENSLEAGLSLFKNNSFLTILDLSSNKISRFCDVDCILNNLMKISLRGNDVKNLSCLKDFPSLCEVDIRTNPLTCNDELANLIRNFSEKGKSPFRTNYDLKSDISFEQCEILNINNSIRLWNSVTYDLCPKGLRVRDVPTVQHLEKAKDLKQAMNRQDNIREKIEKDVKLATEPELKKSNRPSLLLVKPVEFIKKKDFGQDEESTIQSERLSWEIIDQNPEIIENIEEEEEEEEEKEETPFRNTRYSWYTITLLLICLSFALTCFNIAVFLYIRVKVLKNSGKGTDRKYTFLRNEVYKNTTEPSLSTTASIAEIDYVMNNQIKNKIFSFGKINELLLNFGVNKKDKDTDSTKNILFDQSS